MWIWKVVLVIISLVIISVVVFVIGQGVVDKVVTDNTTEINEASKAVISTMSIVYIVVVLFGIVELLFDGNYISTQYKMWSAFGTRMKVAYTAKFGYPNPAFNEEVDRHIRIMRAMSSKELTKKMSEDWLKRMSKFVGIKYVVPEEEHLTEEEKVKNFNDDEYLEKGDL